MGVVRSIVVTIVAVTAVVALIGVGAVVLLIRLLPPRAADIEPGGRAPVGDAVPRSSSPLERYAAVDGSATHLLYASTVRDDKVPVVATYPTRNPWTLLGADGRTAEVPVDAEVSLLGDRPLFLSLTTPPRFRGVNELGAIARAARPLAWRLPDEDRSGTAVLPAGEGVTAFAPDGWVTVRAVGHGGEAVNFAPIERLTRYGIDGSHEDLGIPFPQGAPYSLQTNESGIIAYSDAGDGGDYPPDGRIRFRAWSGSAWRTLNPGYPPQGELECSRSSSTLFLCRDADAHRRYRTLVFHLPAGTTSEMPHDPSGACGTPSIATRTGFVGIFFNQIRDARCTSRTLDRVDLDGRVTVSRHRYDPFHQPVLAFGGIVVDEYREHRMLLVRDVDDAPQVVVGR